MGKSQNIINSTINSIEITLNDLKDAKSFCEKEANKNIIQSAIDSISSACVQLNNYKD